MRRRQGFVLARELKRDGFIITLKKTPPANIAGGFFFALENGSVGCLQSGIGPIYGGNVMQKMKCTVCDWIYDPEKGLAEQDAPAGTPWEKVPPCFFCPECGANKEAFAPTK